MTSGVRHGELQKKKIFVIALVRFRAI
jgi:hypothetical protein